MRTTSFGGFGWTKKSEKFSVTSLAFANVTFVWANVGINLDDSLFPEPKEALKGLSTLSTTMTTLATTKMTKKAAGPARSLVSHSISSRSPPFRASQFTQSRHFRYGMEQLDRMQYHLRAWRTNETFTLRKLGENRRTLPYIGDRTRRDTSL